MICSWVYLKEITNRFETSGAAAVLPSCEFLEMKANAHLETLLSALSEGRLQKGSAVALALGGGQLLWFFKRGECLWQVLAMRAFKRRCGVWGLCLYVCF